MKRGVFECEKEYCTFSLPARLCGGVCRSGADISRWRMRIGLPQQIGHPIVCVCVCVDKVFVLF